MGCPNTGTLATERGPVRRSLNISETSPLANTSLRNHLEHYDERIDRWYKESKNHIYVDFIIGRQDKAIIGVDTKNIFRFFDPETNEVIFWGEKYNLKSLVNEINILLPIVEAESSKPHWVR